MITSRVIGLKHFKRFLHPNIINGNHLQKTPYQPWLQTDLNLSIFETKFHHDFHNDFHSDIHCNIKKSEHFDLIKNRLKSFEVQQQRPSGVRFIEYENIGAFNILKESQQYIASDLIDESGISQDFSKYEKYFFEKNYNAINDLLKEMNNFTSLQMIALQKCLLKSLPLCLEAVKFQELYFSSNFSTIWKKIDSICCLLIKSSQIKDINQLIPFITISNLFFEMDLSRYVTYNRCLFDTFTKIDFRLPKYYFLNMMFIINLEREISKKHESILQEKTEQFFSNENSISLDELSIIGMGFFKTKTKFNEKNFVNFINHSRVQFEKGHETNSNTISAASILKVIRYSHESMNFNARSFRQDILKLVNAFCNANYMNSSICLTHLLLLLNYSNLHNQKKIYKMIFENMVQNFQNFRIKDIERILYCLANAMFISPNSKMKLIENHIFNSEESKIYHHNVSNIVYYMLTLNFFPLNLIKLISDPKFLYDISNNQQYQSQITLLMIDTILRLETNNLRILNEKKVQENLPQILNLYHTNKNTKRSRFLQCIRNVLQPKYGSSMQFMFLLPYSIYPFPVILKKSTLHLVLASCKFIEGNIIEYNPQFLKKGFFHGSKVLQIILKNDITLKDNIRGSASNNERLLKNLGFEVVKLNQIFFPSFVLPTKFCNENSEDYQKCSDNLFNILKNS